MKSFDAFLITIVMMIVAAAAHIIWPTLGRPEATALLSALGAPCTWRGRGRCRSAALRGNNARTCAACVESPPTYDS